MNEHNPLSTPTMLIRNPTGHSQLGRRTKVTSPPIRHWYLAYSRQRFQGLARFRRPPSLHHRKVRRGVTAAQVAHVLQPSRPTAVQELRRAHAEAHVGCRGDGWFRTGVDVAENGAGTTGRCGARCLFVVAAAVERTEAFICLYVR